jgi:hypothetical protein
MLKNTAYAWRQMVFFLALMPEAAVAEFLGWANNHLLEQAEPFRQRFQPALQGLDRAASGESLDTEAAKESGAQRFLGWSKNRHWLLEEPRNQP